MKKYIIIIIGIMLGALGGYLYWNYVGCSGGTCPITSIWYNSTAYGALMGGLLAGTLKTKNR
ncbi:MAG: hypothetical protein DWQ44_13455 [Bacteroidetes bacterium]|nr:MAG: hypothetical protein DWQ33_08265 [Bacteroidota bacterium]REK05730.1 MAG: hypothetical protein DWQ39_04790 [Bacteroidota bacterium]REK31964.1 MAG: hypothetical protein DWQ44_13455 [Bacteroidota bacterium]REK50029.1 MAG: hypothetical protein DWQ48_05680 [Bacteroidota bacterium]